MCGGQLPPAGARRLSWPCPCIIILSSATPVGGDDLTSILCVGVVHPCLTTRLGEKGGGFSYCSVIKYHFARVSRRLHFECIVTRLPVLIFERIHTVTSRFLAVYQIQHFTLDCARIIWVFIHSLFFLGGHLPFSITQTVLPLEFHVTPACDGDTEWEEDSLEFVPTPSWIGGY